MKQILVLIVALLFPFASVMSQANGTDLKGRVVGSESHKALPGVVVTLDNGNETRTDQQGKFLFKNLESGRVVVNFRSAQVQPKQIAVKLIKGEITNLGNVELVELVQEVDNSLVGIMDIDNLDDDGEGQQNISSTVIISNDVFLRKVGFSFSAFRFRPRGLDGVYEQKYINGVSFNDQWRGMFNYSAIGALNDMTRNGDRSNYSSPTDFSYGSLGGVQNIDMRASELEHGSKAALSLTNRNYYARGMYTFGTGLMPNGWAFAGSIGGRYSDRGAIPGTYYRNFAYAFSAEKVWNGGEHSLSFVTFGSPVNRGKQGVSTQEAYDLVKDNQYNPNWGYQNGKRRNSKTVQAYDPTFILSHKWNINEDARLTTGAGVHYQMYGSTALNWYDAPDPRPDYYRHLPSYLLDPKAADYRKILWMEKTPSITQLDWDKMIEINRLNGKEGNREALYMVENRHSNLFETTLNSTLNLKVSDICTINAGVEGRYSKSLQYKTADDLLGSDYLMDFDKFAERDFNGDINVKQNDMNRPNRKVFKNGIFGYNYDVHILSSKLWVNNIIKGARWEGYYAANLGYTTFWREGKMRNGRFPNNSYGKGKTHEFLDYGMKVGAMYKFNGRQFLSANISYGSYAPIPYNSYISPRVSDETVNNLESNKVFSMDVNYIFSTPKINGRISLFQTNFMDDMKRSSYYDDSQRTFVHCVMDGVNRIHRGIEAGFTYKIDGHWSVDFAGTYADYHYTNNPNATINAENGNPVEHSNETVYLKNYKVGNTPQMIGTLGLRYFVNYWFFGVNVNGFGRNYIDFAPKRHLQSTYKDVIPNTQSFDNYLSLTDQEKFKNDFTLSLSIGKIYYTKKRNAINFNLTVDNVLNNKDIRTGGFEQGRVDVNKPGKFPSKYFYMQGINCYANLSYRF